MPQTPKPPPDDESPQVQDRSYYYDDAHGYEDYDPETEECDDVDPVDKEAG